MRLKKNDKISTFETMEIKVQIPFQQLMVLVKSLPPSQKAKLKKELDEDTVKPQADDFINFLLNGPVYSQADIAIVEDNRKSIATWRNKTVAN
jgi:hypothetical protein